MKSRAAVRATIRGSTKARRTPANIRDLENLLLKISWPFPKRKAEPQFKVTCDAGSHKRGHLKAVVG